MGEQSPGPLTPEEQAVALQLARGAVETSVRTGRLATPEELGVEVSGNLLDDYGVFVTLEIDGNLRGCIGNIWPVAPLWEGILSRGRDAALNDRRFRPVREEELAHIEIELSVLTTPVRVDSYTDIVIGRHGIVLERDGRRAVYLPQVAPEQGWDVEETLSHLSTKAGLPSDAWREGATFEVFEAQVFHEISE